MKVNGVIYTEFDIESFDAIKSLCQTIGIVDENGELIAELKNDKIVTYWFDEWEDKHIKVLYDQPFDVKYASTLMRLYELSSNYLKLSDYMKDRTDGRMNDYQTVKKLKLKKEKDIK